MAQNIKVTSELKEKLMQQFAAQLDKLKSVDSKINLTQELIPVKDKRVSVIITARALYKMFTLVFAYSSEVAWHGLVSRPEQNKFLIEDIIVYPQQVASATVNTDQEEYTKWLMSLPEGTLEKLRFQGHSHVNMSVTPSAVDLTHQQGIVSQLGDEDYYIFAIVNKSAHINIWVYDMISNLKYNTDDIDLFYVSEDIDLEVANMLDWCDKNITKQTYAAKTTYTTAKTEAKPETPKAAAVKTEKPPKKAKKKKAGVVYPGTLSTWCDYADKFIETDYWEDY